MKLLIIIFFGTLLSCNSSEESFLVEQRSLVTKQQKQQNKKSDSSDTQINKIKTTTGVPRFQITKQHSTEQVYAGVKYGVGLLPLLNKVELAHIGVQDGNCSNIDLVKTVVQSTSGGLQWKNLSCQAPILTLNYEEMSLNFPYTRSTFEFSLFDKDTKEIIADIEFVLYYYHTKMIRSDGNKVSYYGPDRMYDIKLVSSDHFLPITCGKIINDLKLEGLYTTLNSSTTIKCINGDLYLSSNLEDISHQSREFLQIHNRKGIIFKVLLSLDVNDLRPPNPPNPPKIKTLRKSVIVNANEESTIDISDVIGNKTLDTTPVILATCGDLEVDAVSTTVIYDHSEQKNGCLAKTSDFFTLEATEGNQIYRIIVSLQIEIQSAEVEFSTAVRFSFFNNLNHCSELTASMFDDLLNSQYLKSRCNDVLPGSVPTRARKAFVMACNDRRHEVITKVTCTK